MHTALPPHDDAPSPAPDTTLQLRAAVAELAAILYGDGPTAESLDTLGPIYSSAVAAVRAAFDDARDDLLHGFSGVLPQDAARYVSGVAGSHSPDELRAIIYRARALVGIG